MPKEKADHWANELKRSGIIISPDIQQFHIHLLEVGWYAVLVKRDTTCTDHASSVALHGNPVLVVETQLCCFGYEFVG